MITDADVRRELNAIVDPCSAAAGLPAGLEDMGLVRAVDIQPAGDGIDGASVAVTLAVTEYGCLMGGPFAQMAWERLTNLAGVVQVDVRLDHKFDWRPDDMAAPYRRALDEHRQYQRTTRPVHLIRSHHD